jgi:hypothetical protein
MTLPTTTLPAQTRSRTTIDDDAGGGGPSETGQSLVEQARAYARVAREAMQNCKQGAEAVDELQRRRNQSGQ